MLILKRTGYFTVKTEGRNHCGTMAEQQVYYETIVTCAKILDHRGFLFDQLNLQGFFDGIKKTDRSCEQLCIRCVYKILRMIMKENPKCKVHKIELTLSPAPFQAQITHVREVIA